MATITLRIDAEEEELLADLTADGSNRATVIRNAIQLAWRELRRRQLLAESEAIASNAVDLAEIRAARHDMRAVGAR